MLECTRCRKPVFLLPGDSWIRATSGLGTGSGMGASGGY